MKILQFTLLFGLLTFAPFSGFAQDDDEEKPAISQEEYDKLLILMIDEKYDKLLYKAIKFTEEEETKNEPRPYVIMAQAFFAISQSGNEEWQEKYPKAYTDAIKYALKFVKKDKNQEVIGEYTEFFNELRRAMMNEAEMHVDDEKYSKAKRQYKNMFKMAVDEEDGPAWLMYGTMLWMDDEKSDAEEAWVKARELLANGGKGLEDVQLDLLKYGVIYTAEALAGAGQLTEARAWIQLVDSTLGSDREVQAVLRSL